MFNNIKKWLINDYKKKWFRRSTFREWFVGFGTNRFNSLTGFLWFITVSLLVVFFVVNLKEPVTNNFGETFNIIATVVVAWIGYVVGVNKS